MTHGPTLRPLGSGVFVSPIYPWQGSPRPKDILQTYKKQSSPLKTKPLKGPKGPKLSTFPRVFGLSLFLGLSSAVAKIVASNTATCSRWPSTPRQRRQRRQRSSRRRLQSSRRRLRGRETILTHLTLCIMTFRRWRWKKAGESDSDQGKMKGALVFHPQTRFLGTQRAPNLDGMKMGWSGMGWKWVLAGWLGA